jgi:Zn finger protein HypA/HybF involved in hydrogenase expression
MKDIDDIENIFFHNFIKREELGTFLSPSDEIEIGFRIQFFCKRCKLILSPNKLVQGCPKCQEQFDLLHR